MTNSNLLSPAGMFAGRTSQLHNQSRAKKYSLFASSIQPRESDVVLDLGAGIGDFLEEVYPYKSRIIAVDISWERLARLKQRHPEITPICASALKLPFSTKSADIVFSNAVVEHVGDWSNQMQFANEISRVGKSFFVTTPNYWFPVEQHYRLPLFQYFPRSVQRKVHNHFAIGFIKKGQYEDIYLLSRRQMQKLFPTATVHAQRTTFWPESIIAVRSEPRSSETTALPSPICPTCEGELLSKDRALECSPCGLEFSVREGIPILNLESATRLEACQAVAAGD